MIRVSVRFLGLSRIDDSAFDAFPGVLEMRDRDEGPYRAFVDSLDGCRTGREGD